MKCRRCLLTDGGSAENGNNIKDKDESEMRKGNLLSIAAAAAIMATAPAYTSSAALMEKLSLDGANFAAKIDLASIRASEAYKIIEPMLKSKESAAPVDPAADPDSAEAVLKTLGIDMQSVGEVAILARIPEEKAGGKAPDPDVIIGVDLGKPVQFDAFAKGIQTLTAKEGVKVERVKENGAEFLKFKSPEGSEILMTIANGGKTLLAGTPKDVVKAASSSAGGKLAADLTQILAASNKTAQIVAAVTLDKVKPPKAAVPGQPADPMDSLKSISLDVLFGKDVKIGSHLTTTDAKLAGEICKNINLQLNQAKMMAVMFTQGQPLSFIQTLNAKQATGSSNVEINVTVTPQDIETVKKLAEQMQQGMGVPPGVGPGEAAEGDDDAEDDEEDDGKATPAPAAAPVKAPVKPATKIQPMK